MEQNEIEQNMIRRLANFFSILLHPALMTTYATFIMFNTGSEYPYLNPDQKLFMYGFIFLVTFVLPVSATPVYLGLGWVKSIYMTTHKERAMPLMISSLAFYLAYYLLRNLQMNSLYLGFILFSGALVFITGVISVSWKISAHLTAIGGIVGLLPILALRLGVNITPWLIIWVLLSGLLGASRLYLGAHTPRQVFTGFALGFFMVFAGLLFF